jgi:hypothetical protein
MASPLRKTLPIAASSFTVNYDHDNSSEVILLVTQTGAVTVNLPGPVGFQARILVKKMSASGTVTIQGPGSILIDLAANYSLAAQYKFVELLSDLAGNWAIIGAN